MLVRLSVATLLGWLLLVGVAEAGPFSWSAPIELDRKGSLSLEAIACVSGTQCTVLDGAGRALTFDPGGLSGPALSAQPVIPGVQIGALSCPSETQCTAIGGGREVTFDPTTGTVNAAGVKTIGRRPGFPPEFVSCPSVAQCTALTRFGDEVTFDPATGAVNDVGMKSIDDAEQWAISCPSVTQCTAIGGDHAVTFDPTTGKRNGAGVKTIGPRKSSALVSVQGPRTLRDVSCPSVTQCTAVDGTKEFTFDPTTGTVSNSRRLTRDEDLPFALSCVSVKQCTAITNQGNAVTFDPTTGRGIGPGVTEIGPGAEGVYLSQVSCGSATQCAVIDDGGGVVAFDPTTGTINTGGRREISRGTALGGPVCPSVRQCTATAGRDLVTFDPSAADVAAGAKPIKLRPRFRREEIWELACPSIRQCTSVSLFGGKEVTFDPRSGRVNAAGPKTIDAHASLAGIACPSVRQCTMLDHVDGQQVTFNPRTGRRGAMTRIAPDDALDGIACPSVTRCTALRGGGRALTFNPRTGRTTTPATKLFDPNPYGETITCASVRQCTVVVSDGLAVTFDPKTGRRSRGGVMSLAPGRDFTGLSCPSVRWCTAVGPGIAVTFDPRSPGSPTAQPIVGASGLAGVACPSPSLCVTVDDTGAGFVGMR